MDFKRARYKLRGQDLPHFLSFVFFSPLLVVGPIERAADILPQIRSLRPLKLRSLCDGLILVGLGMMKYYLMAPAWDLVADLIREGNGVLNWLAFGASATLAAYCLFGGIGDIGRGCAQCFGISVHDNFLPMFLAQNPNDYWARWNNTLSRWIRDFVSLPLIMRYGRSIHPYFFILFSFFIVGIWHGLSLNWILFGLFNGAVIIGYDLVSKFCTRAQPNAGAIAGRRAAGTIFVFLLLAGNGILKDEQLFLRAPHSENQGLRGIHLLGLALFVAHAAFAKRTFPRSIDAQLMQQDLRLKTAISIGLLILFFFLLQDRFFGTSPISVPIYFRI